LGVVEPVPVVPVFEQHWSLMQVKPAPQRPWMHGPTDVPPLVHVPAGVPQVLLSTDRC